MNEKQAAGHAFQYLELVQSVQGRDLVCFRQRRIVEHGIAEIFDGPTHRQNSLPDVHDLRSHRERANKELVLSLVSIQCIQSITIPEQPSQMANCKGATEIERSCRRTRT